MCQAKAPNQSTLFSFMKKKDPSQNVDPKVDLNFVTPASKEALPVAEADAPKVSTSTADELWDEEDSDIERLVRHSSTGTSAPPQSPSDVVDLTADKELAPKKLSNVVSATKKRKAPSKKKTTAVAINSLLSSVTPLQKVPAVESAVDREDFKDVQDVSSPVVGGTNLDAMETNTNEVPTLDGAAVTDPAATDAAIEQSIEVDDIALKTPATKKRVRKPSVKKVEAVAAAILDPETPVDEATDGPAATTPEDSESADPKPAAKRVRKPVAKPVEPEVVYPAHVLVKVQANQDKLNLLLAELQQLER